MANDRRQEIWDRIRAEGREKVILDEMIRLGFWPKRGTLPEDPAEEIHRQGELGKRLHELTAELRKIGDAERVRREIRKRRMEESKRKQKETKERRERERLARAEAWREKKTREVVYLGRGVSGGLNALQSDETKLAKNGLPVIHTPAELAAAMGVGIGELRFLAYHRKTARLTHYRRFAVPKKSGGVRVISAPMPRLKAAQHWILRSVVEKLGPHDAAHGFRAARSIVTNAAQHTGAEVVVNVDLRDFFPSIRYPRVKRMFQWMGYSESVATVVALICTAADVEEVELDGKTFWVAKPGDRGAGAPPEGSPQRGGTPSKGGHERRLPQGAPTSPAITNVLCQRLDRKLAKMAANLGYTYSRYADDLSFSGSGQAAKDQAGLLLSRVRFFVEKEGLAVHEDKVRVQRRGRRREVTGLVVSGEKPAVPREELRRFRAVLFQIEKDGPAGKTWGDSPDVMAAIAGFASYVRMVDRAKGEPLVARVKALHRKHGWAPKYPRLAKPARAAADGGTPVAADGGATKKWWKLW